jgi:hypothetical protein
MVRAHFVPLAILMSRDSSTTRDERRRSPEIGIPGFAFLWDRREGHEGAERTEPNGPGMGIKKWRNESREPHSRDAILNSVGARHGWPGRLWGGLRFLRRLEQRLGRPVHRWKPGPKPNAR